MSISKTTLIIKLVEKKETERILLILINGILDYLEQDIISVREAELAVFSTSLLTQRMRKKINNNIIDIVYNGICLEDILDWMPHKFKERIHEMQKAVIALLSKYDYSNIAKPWIENTDNQNILLENIRIKKLKCIKINYDKINAIYMDTKEKSEIIILGLLNGILVSLENKVISLDYAQKSFFSIYTTEILKSNGLRDEIIDLIQKGMELDSYFQGNIQKYESTIREMKNIAYSLLKECDLEKDIDGSWIRTIRCKKLIETVKE